MGGVCLGGVCLIEWPQKGAEFLASADLVISINSHDDVRTLHIASKSAAGDAVVCALSAP